MRRAAALWTWCGESPRDLRWSEWGLGARGAVDRKRGGRRIAAGEVAGEADGDRAGRGDGRVVGLVGGGHVLARLCVAGRPHAADLLVTGECPGERPGTDGRSARV